MTDPVRTPRRRAPVGRVILLVAAYSPAAIILGFRILPCWAGWIMVAAGFTGVVTWAVFLGWLPHTQPRDVSLSQVEPIDAEVTAYIASYLLPIVAATPEDAGDIAAYATCAMLVLAIAFTADLSSVNPLIYIFGFRVVRAYINARPMILLVDELPPERCEKVILRYAIGIPLYRRRDN